MLSITTIFVNSFNGSILEIGLPDVSWSNVNHFFTTLTYKQKVKLICDFFKHLWSSNGNGGAEPMNMGSKSPELKAGPKTDPLKPTQTMNMDSHNPERESSNPRFPTPDSSNLGGGADQGAGAGAGASSGSGTGAEDLTTTQLEKTFKTQRSITESLANKRKAQLLAY